MRIFAGALLVFLAVTAPGVFGGSLIQAQTQITSETFNVGENFSMNQGRIVSPGISAGPGNDDTKRPEFRITAKLVSGEGPVEFDEDFASTSSDSTLTAGEGIMIGGDANIPNMLVKGSIASDTITADNAEAENLQANGEQTFNDVVAQSTVNGGVFTCQGGSGDSVLGGTITSPHLESDSLTVTDSTTLNGDIVILGETQFASVTAISATLGKTIVRDSLQTETLEGNTAQFIGTDTVEINGLFKTPKAAIGTLKSTYGKFVEATPVGSADDRSQFEGDHVNATEVRGVEVEWTNADIHVNVTIEDTFTHTGGNKILDALKAWVDNMSVATLLEQAATDVTADLAATTADSLTVTDGATQLNGILEVDGEATFASEVTVDTNLVVENSTESSDITGTFNAQMNVNFLGSSVFIADSLVAASASATTFSHNIDADQQWRTNMFLMVAMNYNDASQTTEIGGSLSVAGNLNAAVLRVGALIDVTGQSNIANFKPQGNLVSIAGDVTQSSTLVDTTVTNTFRYTESVGTVTLDNDAVVAVNFEGGSMGQEFGVSIFPILLSDEIFAETLKVDGESDLNNIFTNENATVTFNGPSEVLNQDSFTVMGPSLTVNSETTAQNVTFDSTTDANDVVSPVARFTTWGIEGDISTTNGHMGATMVSNMCVNGHAIFNRIFVEEAADGSDVEVTTPILTINGDVAIVDTLTDTPNLQADRGFFNSGTVGTPTETGFFRTPELMAGTNLDILLSGNAQGSVTAGGFITGGDSTNGFVTIANRGTFEMGFTADSMVVGTTPGCDTTQGNINAMGLTTEGTFDIGCAISSTNDNANQCGSGTAVFENLVSTIATLNETSVPEDGYATRLVVNSDTTLIGPVTVDQAQLDIKAISANWTADAYFLNGNHQFKANIDIGQPQATCGFSAMEDTTVAVNEDTEWGSSMNIQSSDVYLRTSPTNTACEDNLNSRFFGDFLCHDITFQTGKIGEVGTSASSVLSNTFGARNSATTTKPAYGQNLISAVRPDATYSVSNDVWLVIGHAPGQTINEDASTAFRPNTTNEWGLGFNQLGRSDGSGVTADIVSTNVAEVELDDSTVFLVMPPYNVFIPGEMTPNFFLHWDGQASNTLETGPTMITNLGSTQSRLLEIENVENSNVVLFDNPSVVGAPQQYISFNNHTEIIHTAIRTVSTLTEQSYFRMVTFGGDQNPVSRLTVRDLDVGTVPKVIDFYDSSYVRTSAEATNTFETVNQQWHFGRYFVSTRLELQRTTSSQTIWGVEHQNDVMVAGLREIFGVGYNDDTGDGGSSGYVNIGGLVSQIGLGGGTASSNNLLKVVEIDLMDGQQSSLFVNDPYQYWYYTIRDTRAMPTDRHFIIDMAIRTSAQVDMRSRTWIGKVINLLGNEIATTDGTGWERPGEQIHTALRALNSDTDGHISFFGGDALLEENNAGADQWFSLDSGIATSQLTSDVSGAPGDPGGWENCNVMNAIKITPAANTLGSDFLLGDGSAFTPGPQVGAVPGASSNADLFAATMVLFYSDWDGAAFVTSSGLNAANIYDQSETPYTQDRSTTTTNPRPQIAILSWHKIRTSVSQGQTDGFADYGCGKLTDT